MKRALSLIVGIMVLLFCMGSLAEAFQGNWVQFEDGFEMLVPYAWGELDVTPELEIDGCYSRLGQADLSEEMRCDWQEMDIASMEELTSYAADLGEAEAVALGERQFVSYTLSDGAAFGFLMLDEEIPGAIYRFEFAPGRNEALVGTAQAIMGSMRDIVEEDDASDGGFSLQQMIAG